MLKCGILSTELSCEYLKNTTKKKSRMPRKCRKITNIQEETLVWANVSSLTSVCYLAKEVTYLCVQPFEQFRVNMVFVRFTTLL